MTRRKIIPKTVGRDAHTAYIALPGHRDEPGVVAKMLDLAELIEKYQGPRVHLDFNKRGVLIGIEILA